MNNGASTLRPFSYNGEKRRDQLRQNKVKGKNDEAEAYIPVLDLWVLG